MPVELHPARRLIGCHVLCEELGFRRFVVVDLRNQPVSRHVSLAAACARARWHSGTRFVYVEFASGYDGMCWDGYRSTLVDWDACYRTMCEGITEPPRGLATLPPESFSRARRLSCPPPSPARS